MIYPKENWLTDDEHGVQMPWYTRPCLEVINEWDFKDKRVFEYGMGYSTIWYASRMAILSGVDSDKTWFNFIMDQLYHKYDIESETAFVWRDPAAGFTKWEYVSEIGVYRQFDFVIIDGLYRDDCAEYAIKKINPGGKLILDNWLQPDVMEFWPKTENLIKGMDIRIFKEPTHPNWQTAIVTVP